MIAERGGHRTTVLVVDDSPDTISLLRTALEDEGMTVLVAASGSRALAIARRAIPDIILMDAVMPGTDGFETTRQIKADSRLADIPVIFMTGLSETEHVLEAFEAGGVDYVTKPVVIEQVFARMRVHQANARKTRSARLALDSAGRHLFAIDASGEVLWTTPWARRHILEGAEGPIPASVLKTILASLREGRATATEIGTGLSFAFLGEGGDGEFLLRVSQIASDATLIASLNAKLPISPREAEVLLWLSRGKSNQDIADILKLSVRTVNKHLETVFRKLGVENRSAATAIAMEQIREFV